MELFGVIIVLLIVFVFLTIRENRKEKEEPHYVPYYSTSNYLTEAGKALGCKMNSSGNYGTGTLQGVTYSLKTVQETNENYGVEVFINHTLPLRGLSSITKETMLSKIKKDFGSEDVLIGDRFFDEKMLIKAQNPCGLVALLNHRTREHIIDLYNISGTFEISNSWLRTTLYPAHCTKDGVIELVKTAVAVSRDLSAKSDIKQMLIDNIFTDPRSEVRLNNLELLSSNFASSPDLQQVYRDALKDSSLNLQIAAASRLGEKGMGHLLSVIMKAQPGRNILIDIIRLFGKHHYREAGEFLSGLFKQTDDREVKLEILRAFEGMADERLIPFLTRLLRKNDPSLLGAAVRALGTCGSLDMMNTLYTLYKNDPRAEIREEASRAMGRIQSRFGVERGWLSMAELSGPEGALSLTDGAGEGSLSLTEEKGEEK